jgi:hypothetical protein
MSDRTPPPPLPPPKRDVFLAFLLVLVGAVLLLPGICVLVFVSSDPKGMLTDSLGLTLLATCLAVSAGGFATIWAGV